MKFILSVLIVLSFVSNGLAAQDLLNERIRKLTPTKKSIFLDRGIFHNGGAKTKATLKGMRHSFRKKNGFERIVFDFKESDVPRIYGYLSPNEKTLYIDFFKTSLVKQIGSFGNSKYVKGVNFFPISADSLSVEIVFKSSVSIDAFYLNGPGRFVIDVK